MVLNKIRFKFDDTAVENDLQINITTLALIVTFEISSAFEHRILGFNMSFRVPKNSPVCIVMLYDCQLKF